MVELRPVVGVHGSDSADVVELARIWREARAGCLAFLNRLHTEAEDRAFIASSLLGRHQVWVADRAGEVAGFVAFGEGWVHQLYVRPRHQRCGVGRRLLDAAKASAAALELWAFEVNVDAIAFYRSQGFAVVERTDGHGNEANRPDVRMRWAR